MFLRFISRVNAIRLAKSRSPLALKVATLRRFWAGRRTRNDHRVRVVEVGAVISEETLAIRLLCQGAGDRRARLDVGELALPLEATGASKVVGALLSQLRCRLCFDLALQSREAVGLGRLLLEDRVKEL